MSNITAHDQNLWIWIAICFLTLLFVGAVFGFWFGIIAVCIINIIRMCKSNDE